MPSKYMEMVSAGSAPVAYDKADEYPTPLQPPHLLARGYPRLAQRIPPLPRPNTLRDLHVLLHLVLHRNHMSGRIK